jgi:cytochrome c oxidase assembly protein subunit 15
VVRYNSTFKNVLLFSLLLTLIQVAIGTQVRQFVDEQVKNGLTASILWLQDPSITFYVHRSFSILVLFVNLYLYVRNTKLGLGFSKQKWVLSIITIEIITGIAMAYFDFPIGSQAIHLVLASILFGIQFYMILEAKKPIPANS